MKNPFKKQGIMATLVNVGIGGVANVAIDYVVSSIDALSQVSDTYINAGKIAVGVVGTMTGNNYVHAATDGIAVVGVSNLVKSLMADEETPVTTDGLPYGTIGNCGKIGRKVIMGNRAFKRNMSGVGRAFMDK